MRFLNKTIAGIVACTSIISLSGMYSTTAMAVLDDCVEYTLTEETTNFYDQWKSKYLIKNNYVTDEDQYYVLYSEGTYADNQYTTEVTVSEAHGYGMLIGWQVWQNMTMEPKRFLMVCIISTRHIPAA